MKGLKVLRVEASGILLVGGARLGVLASFVVAVAEVELRI